MTKPLVDSMKREELNDSTYDLTDRVNAECEHIDELLEAICESEPANRQNICQIGSS